MFVRRTLIKATHFRARVVKAHTRNINAQQQRITLCPNSKPTLSPGSDIYTWWQPLSKNKLHSNNRLLIVLQTLPSRIGLSRQSFCLTRKEYYADDRCSTCNLLLEGVEVTLISSKLSLRYVSVAHRHSGSSLNRMSWVLRVTQVAK